MTLFMCSRGADHAPIAGLSLSLGRHRDRGNLVPRSWGGVIAHLEIESIQPPRAPLPITETGYKSHFHPCGTVEANGGDVVAQIIAWLDEEAAKPEWRAYAAKSRQGELF